jgi:hypothetical protein
VGSVWTVGSWDEDGGGRHAVGRRLISLAEGCVPLLNMRVMRSSECWLLESQLKSRLNVVRYSSTVLTKLLRQVPICSQRRRSRGEVFPHFRSPRVWLCLSVAQRGPCPMPLRVPKFLSVSSRP